MEQQPTVPHRVVVIGDSCSGKSTLARRLAAAVDAPYVELDALHWRPGWTPAPVDEFLSALDEVAAGERWVTAGNYTSRAQVTTWPHADLVVWLDMPLWRVLPRMVRRTWRRWQTRELLWGTNVEDPWQHLRLWEVDRNLFSYTVLRHHARRRDYRDAMRDHRWAGTPFVRLRSPADVEAFARAFEVQASGKRA